MKDRVSTQVLANGALRYGIYNADGTLNRYEYIKPEDLPSEVGSAINKANLLPDLTANKLWPTALKPSDPQVGGALDRLSGGMLYQQTTIRRTIFDLSDGEVFQLHENGVSVDFIKLTNNYESSGRVAVIRKDTIGSIQWGSAPVTSAVYPSGIVDTYLNNTYLPTLDEKSQVTSVTIKRYGGTQVPNVASSVGTMSAKIFAPSAVECGSTGLYYDGVKINSLVTNKISDSSYWLRTPGEYGVANAAFSVSDTGVVASIGKGANSAVRPMFTLPNEFVAKITTHPSITDLLGNLVSIPGGQVVDGVKIASGRYVGTGTSGQSNPNTLTFPFTPKIVFISPNTTSGVSIYRPAIYVWGSLGITVHVSSFSLDSTTESSSGAWCSCPATTSGNSFSWYTNITSIPTIKQLNSSSVIYRYVAIG